MSRSDVRPVLITGGAGFVGANLAHRLLSGGEHVLLLDNLSRPNVVKNVEWLKSTHGDRVELKIADTRDRAAVETAVRRASMVYHFAAQVAVTTSLTDPLNDFHVNALGTLNVLEAIRGLPEDVRPPIVFTSTNKVYGALPDVVLRRVESRYEPADSRVRLTGISEARPLDFHSPYGCSKGSADQYVMDYGRTFGLDAVVLRMSCIYGQRQFGTEDQGWLAHFMIRALQNEPITIYGDGMQVRDALYVDDLVDAFLICRRDIKRLTGAAYNMGGGPANTLSLLELIEMITELTGRRPALREAEVRPGDQRYYVSDFRRFTSLTGWSPKVRVREGVRRLHGWLRELHGHGSAEGAMVEVA